ncbi:MAG TPA: hypothetical protein VF995_02250 [Actinomycetota bacterium]
MASTTWPEPVRRVVAEAEAGATMLIGLHSARPFERWPLGRVTLLGDAAHSLSPARGRGRHPAPAVRAGAAPGGLSPPAEATGPPRLVAGAELPQAVGQGLDAATLPPSR